MKLKYYKELNGIRGLAALMVMYFHFMPIVNKATDPVLYYFYKAAVFGQTGVTLFFVLSGFLITRILMLAKGNAHYFRNFYIKRALRIFPLYYLGLIIFYFFAPLLFGTATAPNNQSWMYWLYLQNFSDTFLWGAAGPQHFWSLAVEEHFYLFWPLIVHYTPNKKLLYVIAGIVTVALICRMILVTYGYGTFYFTFSVMDALAIGGFLAWIEIQHPSFKINYNLLIISGLLLMIVTWLFIGGKGYNWIQIIKLPVIAIFYMAVIGKIIGKKSVFKRLWESGFLGYTGKISYGLYVFHPLCFSIYYKYFPGNTLFINGLTVFALSYLVASISFYLFEIHFLKLKKYFESAKWFQETTALH